MSSDTCNTAFIKNNNSVSITNSAYSLGNYQFSCGRTVFFKSFTEFAVGLIVSAISQVGDLVASVIKRRYGIKDYGKIFPGHGGVLDRFDSVMATSTVILIMTLIPSLIKMVE